jgi:uncharacterized delta-60 repeat protein
MTRPTLTRLEGRDTPAGNLDLSFGGTGRVAVDFGANDVGEAVAVQPDGKIVVAGTRDPSANTSDFLVARYNPDGSLDATFGTAGRTTLSLTGRDTCTAIALQADGKIVLAGITGTGGVTDFAVARLNANGTPDLAFGGSSTGWRAIDFGQSDAAAAVVIQPDGSIVLAGTSTNDIDASSFALARLTSAGAFDTTFDGDGKATFTTGLGFCRGSSLALQPDGKLVVAGDSGVPNDPTKGVMAVLRLTNTGGIDTTFDTDGWQTVAFGTDYATTGKLLLQGDGKVVLVGGVDYPRSADFVVARLTAAGALDTTFSGDGKATYLFAGADTFGTAIAVAQQKDGKLVVAGTTTRGVNAGASEFGVLRLLADGTLDATFSGDGKQTVAIGTNAVAYGAVVQDSGKILLAGYATAGTDTNLALARLVGRDTDLIARTSGGQWWLNRTTGSGFAVASATFWTESLGWRDVASADVTGDGVADLVGRTADGQWYVSASARNGTFAATQLWAWWNELAGWRDVRLADVSGDGRADVLGRTSGGEWWVGVSTGTGFNTTSFAGWNEAAGWKDVQAGDVDGDGKADVIARTSGGQWWVGRSTGSAFNTSLFAGWNEAAGWRDVRVGDFNGDGKTDVVGRTNTGQWWVGTSTGTAFTTTLFAGWNEAANWKDVRVGDFNGDGKADVVGRASDGSWWVGTSTGSAFTTTQWGGWNEAAGWRDVRVGDFNGDGRMDLAARTSGGQWYVGVSTGTAFSTALWATWNEAAGWKDILAGAYVG